MAKYETSKLMEAGPSIEALEKECKTNTEMKCVQKIQFGVSEIDTWYSSPFPGKYRKQSKLFFCEFCLKYMKSEEALQNHWGVCLEHHPPGIRIYRKGLISVYEVDGADHKVYCRNLCLLGKLFLDDKVVFDDVETALFYVLAVRDEDYVTDHLIGYFSKEKGYPEATNVGCLLILPPFQKSGFGNFLISFSYELTKLDNTVGSPERPLSDLGRRSYLNYWSRVILETMKDHKVLPLKDLSMLTGMTVHDIIYTLETLGMSDYLSNQRILCIPLRKLEKKLKYVHPRKPKFVVDTKYLEYGPLRKQQSLFRSSYADFGSSSLPNVVPQKSGRS